MKNELQVYVFGPTMQGFLELPAGASLDIEEFAAIFDENFSVGSFSLPTEAEWTDNNRKLLGFAERLENFHKRDYWWRCHVYANGWPEMLNAKLTLIGKQGRWNYTKGTFKFSISGTKGLFGAQIKNKRLKDLWLGGIINYTTESRDFATAVMKGQLPQLTNKVKFAPVAIENFFDTTRADYTDEFLILDTVNAIVTNGSGNWQFGRRSVIDSTVATGAGATEHIDYRTVPFFLLPFVLKSIFSENGYNVTGAIVEDANFADVVIFNNYSLEQYNYTNKADTARTLIPGNHLPDMLVSEFLKSIFQGFSAYPVFDYNNEIKLVYRIDDLTKKRVLNLNKYVSEEFESTINEANNYNDNPAAARNNGFKINFKWDSNDSLPGERIKDLSSKTLLGSVPTKAALNAIDSATYGRSLTTDDIVLVEAENMYYNVANASVSPILWDCYSENLHELVVGNGDKTVELGFGTLCTHVVFNESTALWERRNMVAAKMKGSYQNKKNVFVKSSFGLSLFFIRNENIAGQMQPVSTNLNKLADNSRTVKYSFGLTAIDSIGMQLHKLWQEKTQNIEVVDTEILCNTNLLDELKNSNTIEVHGTHFLPYKIERSIPIDDTIKIFISPL